MAGDKDYCGWVEVNEADFTPPYFWLGASAFADPATHEPSQGLGPSGECPLREEMLLAFRDLTIACVEWASASDACLIHYPVDQMERAMALLDPIFGQPGSLQ